MVPPPGAIPKAGVEPTSGSMKVSRKVQRAPDSNSIQAVTPDPPLYGDLPQKGALKQGSEAGFYRDGNFDEWSRAGAWRRRLRTDQCGFHESQKIFTGRESNMCSTLSKSCICGRIAVRVKASNLDSKPEKTDQNGPNRMAGPHSRHAPIGRRGRHRLSAVHSTGARTASSDQSTAGRACRRGRWPAGCRRPTESDHSGRSSPSARVRPPLRTNSQQGRECLLEWGCGKRVPGAVQGRRGTVTP